MRERKIYLDYLRVFATFSVILIHIFTTARTDYPNHTLNEDFFVTSFANIFHFAVPLFLMITGTIFLDPGKKIDAKNLFKKYIFRYVFILFTFGLAFSIMENMYKYNFTSKILLISLKDVFLGNTWNHMWYVYVLIGILLLIPFIKELSNILDKNVKLKRYFILLGILSCFIYPYVNSTFDITLPISIPLFSNFVFYVFFGYIISKIDLDKIKKQYLIYTIIILLLVIIVSNYLYIYKKIEMFRKIDDYDSLIILILSTSIYLLFRKINFKKNKIIEIFSSFSFGIYIIHMFWINVIYKIMNFNIFNNYIIVKVTVIFFVVSLLSAFSTFIFKKIPVLNKYI